MYEVIIIGAGQFGLTCGYLLQKKGISYLVLEKSSKVGESWRRRYDSLVLLTSRLYSHLLNLSFTPSEDGFATKDEFANYLNTYSKKNKIKIRFNSKVNKLKKNKDKFIIETENQIFTAKNVIVCTGINKPKIPDLSKRINKKIQIHSSQYKNPNKYKSFKVLVVGAGNSGIQISQELSEKQKVVLSSSNKIKIFPKYFLGKSLDFWLNKLFITTIIYSIDGNTYLGKILKKMDHPPVFTSNEKFFLKSSNLTIKPKLIDIQKGEAIFSDASHESFDKVIWATGFVNDFSWILVRKIFDKNKKLIHKRGVTAEKGLFFLGLPWLYGKDSTFISGAERDSKYIVDIIAKTSTKKPDFRPAFNFIVRNGLKPFV